MNLTVPAIPTISPHSGGTFTARTETGAFIMGDVSNPSVPSITIAEFSSRAKAESAAYAWWLRRVTEAASYAFANANKIDGVIAHADRAAYQAANKS